MEQASKVVTYLKVLSGISLGDWEENRETLRIAGDLIVTGTEQLMERNIERYQLHSGSRSLCFALP
jgi:hypothetical protein